METDNGTHDKTAEMINLISEHEKEKEYLLRIINTYGMLAETIPDFKNDVKDIKVLLQENSERDTGKIEKKINQLRAQIFSRELSTLSASSDSGLGADTRLHRRSAQMVRMLRRVTDFFLENFYPLEDMLDKKAQSIRIDLDPEVSEKEIADQVAAFLEYSRALKQKILLDFSSANTGFQDLLAQVSQLESVILTEFDPGDKAKQFQAFENSIGKEMGAISEAFVGKKNIHELKTAVLDRLQNIRQVVKLKKESEKKQLEKANDTIKELRKKISIVEAMADKFSSKARTYRKQALIDALTGVNNRKSFDLKVERELAMLDEQETLALVVWDINDFKWINDSFGHVAGDKVLKVVADNLKKNFRKSDFVARYGGMSL